MFSKRKNLNFNLSFNEAMEFLLSRNTQKAFIQGEMFSNGLYISSESGTLMLKIVSVKDDVYKGVSDFGNFPLTSSQYHSKFRIINTSQEAWVTD
jgi:hypothetical protein